MNDHLLNYKTFTDDATRKIINGEENHKHLKSEVVTFKTETNIFKSDTNKKLTEADKRITELELAIRSIKDQLAILGSIPRGNSNQSSGDSSAELQILQLTLNKLIERVTTVEGDVSDLQRLKEKVSNIQSTVSDHSKRINNIEDELAELRNLKAKLEMLEQMLRDGKGKASRGSSFEHNTHIGGNGVSIEQVKAMIDEEINKLRDEIMALLEALKAALDKKAEAEDLWKSEAALLEKLDQIAGALMKRAQSDKNDTKKALMFLEKKVMKILRI